MEIPSPSKGHVHLLFSPLGTSSFYLSIPTDIITTLCLKPSKYLHYLGWCILGSLGVLQDDKGNIVDLEGPLTEKGVYHYILPEPSSESLVEVCLSTVAESIYRYIRICSWHRSYKTKDGAYLRKLKTPRRFLCRPLETRWTLCFHWVVRTVSDVHNTV